MTLFWRPIGSAAALLLAAGCVTYPYETAFSGCDAEAGVCYQYCEEFEGTEDYSLCHADCEAKANQCFASAYNAYDYPGPSYSPRYSALQPRPWFGRYGAWYPNTGYAFSFNYYGGGYGYNPRRRYYDPYFGYRGDRRGRHRGDRRRNRNNRDAVVGQGDGQRAAPPPRRRQPSVTPGQPQPKAKPPAARPRPPGTTPRRSRRSKEFPTPDLD